MDAQACLLSFAARECLLPGWHNCETVHAVSERPVFASKRPKDGGLMIPGDQLFTWKPAGSFLVTLMKLESGHTVVCPHVEGGRRMYFATPSASLGPRVRPGTALVAQYVEDRIEGGETTPRLLVFDVVVLDFKRLDGVPVGQRYAMLREGICPLGPATPSENTACPSILVVQWVGEFVCSPTVLDGSMGLPHEVGGLLLLRDDCPGVVDLLPA